jgi:hypothetical protein
VSNNDRAHRPRSNQQPNLPVLLNRKSTSQHRSRHSYTEQKRPLELPGNVAHSFQEWNILDFLGCAAPLHVDAEKVGHQRLTDVNGDASKKNGEHRYPFDILLESGKDVSVFNSIPQPSKRQIAHDGKDEYKSDVDPEAVDIVMIQRAVEKANEEVVEDRKEPGGSNSIVCANIRHDGDFGMQRHPRPQKDKEHTGKGAFVEPVSEWVEDEFATAVSVSAKMLV